MNPIEKNLERLSEALKKDRGLGFFVGCRLQHIIVVKHLQLAYRSLYALTGKATFLCGWSDCSLYLYP